MKDFYEPPEIITPDMEGELVFVPPEGTPFWKKLLCYAAVWLVMIVIACGIMWSVMSQYEAALPKTAMDEYILSSRQEMFFLSISDMFDEVDNRFESAYDVASKVSKEFTGTLTYTKLATEYTRENPVYIIKHNDENLFKVTLEESEETGFMNFKAYDVKSIELIKSDIFSLRSYKLVFAANMLVNVNNVSLGTSLADFEKIDLFGVDNYYGIVVENFTYEPEIVALSYVYADTPEKVVAAKRVGDYYIFEREGEEFSTLTISAPSEAVVSIDGKTVTSFFASEQYQADGGQQMTVYTVPTVFNAEEITVTLDGKQLELIRDGLSLTTNVTGAERVVTVPHGATLMSDGIEIDSSYITDSAAMWHSDFDEIRNYPTAVEYTLNGIASTSALSATLDGKPLTAFTDGDRVVFTSGESEELRSEYAEKAEDFVYQYLYYSTQGYNNTDTNLANTLALVAPSCPLRNYLKLANVGIEYKSPQSMAVEYINADRFIQYGDDAFVCDVSYKATLKTSVSESVEENAIHLIFIRSGGTFLPAKFIL